MWLCMWLPMWLRMWLHYMWLRMWLLTSYSTGSDTGFAVEHSVVDPVNKTMTLRSHNMTGCSVFNMHENITYKASADNTATEVGIPIFSTLSYPALTTSLLPYVSSSVFSVLYNVLPKSPSLTPLFSWHTRRRYCVQLTGLWIATLRALFLELCLRMLA